MSLSCTVFLCPATHVQANYRADFCYCKYVPSQNAIAYWSLPVTTKHISLCWTTCLLALFSEKPTSVETVAGYEQDAHWRCPTPATGCVQSCRLPSDGLCGSCCHDYQCGPSSHTNPSGPAAGSRTGKEGNQITQTHRLLVGILGSNQITQTHRLLVGILGSNQITQTHRLLVGILGSNQITQTHRLLVGILGSNQITQTHRLLVGILGSNVLTSANCQDSMVLSCQSTEVWATKWQMHKRACVSLSMLPELP